MKIILEPYNSKWPEIFQSFKQRILSACNDTLTVEHIGSTSVHGLAAKPVIDILVGTNDTIALDVLAPDMINAGFTYVTRYDHLLPGRKYFIKYEHPDGLAPPHLLSGDGANIPVGFINVAHIHCWIYGSDDWIRHIAFRDYLRINDSVRAEYQLLKEKLSQQEWESTQAYSEAKNEFIRRVQSDAHNWYITK